jgi:hypothetical protein
MAELIRVEPSTEPIEVRSESERIVALRIAKWGDIGRTAQGNERFDAGAFDADPVSGINQPANVILRMEHEGPPAGRGVELERRDDGQYGVFRVAPTARGDELLTLAREGYYRGVSPSFEEVEGGTAYEGRGEARIIARKRVNLREVSLTWRPTYEGTAVIYARSDSTNEGATMTEDQATNATEAAPIVAGQLMGLESRMTAIEAKGATAEDWRAQDERLAVRIAALEERSAYESRATVPTGAVPPSPANDVPRPYRGDWVQAALKLLDGGSLNNLEQRALADIITATNAGLVPPAYLSEIVGVINPARPFMASTRRVDMPDNGMQIIYPRIVTRPTVGEQMTQKSEVTSTNVSTDTATANVRTFAGAGDISLQLLRRSSPAFLNFYLDLLGEAYAKGTNNAALAALFAAGVTAGGSFDVETGAIPLGAAFTASVNATGQPPDTIWLSSAAVAAMIDARDNDGRPLYGPSQLPTLGNANVAQGVSGSFGGGLRTVWEPALDAATFDADPVGAGSQAARVLVGPSNGFAWAEDDGYNLTADVPGRLGRDVALAGFVAFLPLYPAAFTAYALS